LAFDQVFPRAEDLNKERAARDDSFVDYYEALQISPRADSETVQRVYRMLAQRYHPDNSDSGNEETFRLVLAAFRVLSDPEKRAAYDATHKREHEIRWQIFEKPAETIGIVEEKRIRMGVLSALYKLRQRQPEKPEMNMRELEDLLGCPREHLEFSFWYLRGKGFIERADNSKMRITTDGVDEVERATGQDARAFPRMIEGPHSS
jgi:curved DNA-binding protein CbpA